MISNLSYLFCYMKSFKILHDIFKLLRFATGIFYTSEIVNSVVRMFVLMKL